MSICRQGREVPRRSPARCAAIACCLVAGVLSGACGSSLTCDDVKAYERAREGARIEAPEGLDDLEASRELLIPRASPREPRPEGAPCLDLPPSIQASGSQASD